MSTDAPSPRYTRAWIWLVIVIGIAGLLAANAHLVLVSVASQPECVAHSRSPNGDGMYMAAKSAC